MTRNWRKLFLLLAALGVICAGSIVAGSPAKVVELYAVDDAWVRAYNAGDVDGVTALYDETAVLLPPGAPAVSGRAAIRAYFVKDIAESSKAGIRFQLGRVPSGGVSGDMGWSSGSYSVIAKDGKVLEVGKYLSVSTKVGGKWLYVRDTWNADGPAPKP